MQDAVMMPLKVLRGHTQRQHEGVKAVLWHTKQPWVFSTGSDGKVLCWTWAIEKLFKIILFIYKF